MTDLCTELWKYLFQEASLASKLFAIVEGTISTDDPFIQTRVPSVDAETGLVQVKIPWGKQQLGLQVTKASAVGDNYLSVVYNLKLVTPDPDPQTYNAFAKVIPVNTFLRDVATKSGVHNRENYMYNEIFPALRKLLVENNLNPNEYIQVPDLYFCQLTNPVKNDKSDIVLVLQDMCLQGYRMADKIKGCDLDHVIHALRSLAHFHAVSIAYTRRQLSASKQAFIDRLAESMVMDDQLLPEILQNDVDFMQLLGHSEAAQKIQQLIPKARQILAHEDFQSCGPLGCIIHGDFWVNNMLFQYDPDGRPKQVALVDWQISRLGHPAWDIVYFLLVSTTFKLRQENLDYILKTYYSTLEEALRKLQIRLPEEGYCEADFRADFEKRLLKGTITGCLVLPFILNQGFAETVTSPNGDTVDAPSVTEIDEEAFVKSRDETVTVAYSAQNLYRLPILRQRVSEIILEMVNRGVL